jgi:glycosyltransferase involved in cell wall biosynthesis
VVAPALLLSAVAFAVAVFGLLPDASPAYRTLLDSMDGPAMIGPIATRTRLLVGILVALIAAAARGAWSRRLLSALTAGTVFTILMVTYDVAAGWWTYLSQGESAPATRMLQPLAAGTLSLLATVVLHYRLPPAVAVDRHLEHARRRGPVIIFGLTGLLALLTFAAIFTVMDEPSLFLRSVPVIVLGAGVLPFSPVQTPLLYWLGRRPVVDPGTSYRPSVAVLIPALDEAEHIEDCLAGVERAAMRYAGPCRVYVVDNGSRDGTAAVAMRYLRHAEVLQGRVLECREPGKSRALNTGLRNISEDLVLRIDADTVIGEDAIRLLVLHFSCPDVGAAGGLPLPARTDTWIGRMRQIEVQLNIAVRRVAHNAVQSVMCLPGNVVAYRRALLDRLGEFAEGINGEDTDITLRIARSGFRIVVDSDVKALTAVPATIAELREQRIRWARAGFHVAARNRGLVRLAEGPRGFWFFPLGVIAMHARVLLLPLFVGMVASAASVTRGAVVIESLELIAAATGARLAVAAIVLVAMGKPQAVPWLVGYIPFRLLVLYFSLESFLTLPLRDRGDQDTVPRVSIAVPSPRTGSARAQSLPRIPCDVPAVQ